MATNKDIDWLSEKYDKNNEFKGFFLGDTVRLEQRIIKELKLSKYSGWVMQDNGNLDEKLEYQVFRIMRGELAANFVSFNLTTKISKEVAERVASVVINPVDNRNLITFKNKTIDFKKTREQGKVVFTPERVENHNSVQWNLMTQSEISASPKHAEMRKYLSKLIAGWGVEPTTFFKIAAYAMCKENFADKVFFFKGEGGEGKGTANKMIRRLFEDSASKSYNPMDIKLGSETAFIGSQVVFNDDLDDGALSLTHIKPVATGGDIEIRPLYQSSKTFTPYSTMIFNTNYDIKVGNNLSSKAWNDRQFVIEFKGKNFRGTEEAKEYKKVNPFYNKYFMDVFASVSAAYLLELIDNEFNDEKSMQAKTEDASAKDNVVQKFINEFEPSTTFWDNNTREELPLYLNGTFTTIKELYRYFKCWAKDSNERFIPNKGEFKKQFWYITKIEVDNVSPSRKNLKLGRWIDLKPIIKDEVSNES